MLDKCARMGSCVPTFGHLWTSRFLYQRLISIVQSQTGNGKEDEALDSSPVDRNLYTVIHGSCDPVAKVKKSIYRVQGQQQTRRRKSGYGMC